MKSIELLHGSPEEVGAQLQKNMDRLLDSTRRWAEILAYDPQPQTGMTPRILCGAKTKLVYTGTFRRWEFNTRPQFCLFMP